MTTTHLAASSLNTLFHPCRQCGTCCRQYRKISLQQDEMAFIEKMGGHVGVSVSLKDIREMGMTKARREAVDCGKTYMIHPDDTGCVFLQKRNDKFSCKIYNYRPQACRGFRCNMADDSMLSLTGSDAILLLGQNSFGLPLENE